MVEQALIFDIAEMKRYAIPYYILANHKWSKLHAGGLNWKDLPSDAFTKPNLRLWLQTEVSDAEFASWRADDSVLDLGNGSPASIAAYKQVDNVPIADVPEPTP